MPQFDLNGKTVMITTANNESVGYLYSALKNLGAEVKPMKDLPYVVHHVPETITECGQYPKMDAFIIHGVRADDLERSETRKKILELIQQFKDKCPLVVCSSCESKVALQELQNAGVKHLNYMDMDEEQLASSIADIVAQQARRGHSHA